MKVFFFNLFLSLTFSLTGLTQLDVETFISRGIEDMELDYFFTAEYYFNKAIELDSSCADAFFYRGLTYAKGARADRWDPAIRDFSICIELDSTKNYSEAYYSVGTHMTYYVERFNKRNPSDSLSEFEIKEKASYFLKKSYYLKPSETLLLNVLFWHTFYGYNFVAIDLLTEELIKDENNIKLLKRKGQILLSLYKYDEALNVFDKLIKLNRQDAESYYYNAIIMQEKANMDANLTLDKKVYCKNLKKAKKFGFEIQEYLCKDCGIK
ncbi:MAG: hypothetical protein WC044_09955 [Crocinitomicaceae bacterium]